MKKYLSILLILLVIIPINVFAKTTYEVVETKVTLEKCIDGDTATFKDEKGNTYKTRFLAIDTPESVHPTKEVQAYGKDASEYTCNRLQEAKEIMLETDSNSQPEDKYGRYLAWVFVDGELFQKELIEKSLAKVAYLYGDYKYTEELQETEDKVKLEKKGVWEEENKTKKKNSNTVKKASTKKKNSKKSTKKSKNIFSELLNSLVASIIDAIADLIDSIALSIENMI